MSTTDEALRRVVAQIGDGRDVCVGGTPVQARQCLAEAAVVLAERATVVSVACPIGELGVSALLAQLAGRLDLDHQDDAVLEQGFRRLTGDGQTVLMLLAPGGISRSALRYVQHVCNHAPRLALVLYNASSLALTILEEPDLAALRARLYASPAIEFEAPAAASNTRPVTAAPSEPDEEPFPFPFTEWELETRRGRPALWAACALGVVAILGILWFVQNTPDAAVAGSRAAGVDVPVVPAVVPRPMLAGLPDPVALKLPQADAVVAAAPPLAPVPPSAVTNPAPVALDQGPTQPPLAAPSHPETIVAGLAPPQPRAEHRLRRPDRREAVRSTQARPSWPPPRSQGPAGYESAPPWDGVSPVWVRRDPRRESPYFSPYGYPNGVRAFEYDP